MNRALTIRLKIKVFTYKLFAYNIYSYIVEIVDCVESDKMIKISGKMDKSNTYKDLVVVIFHSFILRTFSLMKFLE